MADSNEARDRSNPLTVIEGARGLREALDRGNYTEAALGKLFASERLQPASAIERAAALHRTRGGSPLELLARLFLLGATLSESEARRALADTALDDWLRSGLLVRTDEGVQGACAIQPFRGHLFASDGIGAPGAKLAPDHVMGVGPVSMALVTCTLRDKVGNVLDLGTGCGVQAVLAAAHSDRVLATDVNPRALSFARFNAAMAGIETIDFAQSNLFDSIGDREFDLVVTNPPYVIAPRAEQMFRDSGLSIDGVCERIVREGARRLAPGGHLQMICSWAHLHKEDYRDRLARWFQGAGCDALVLRSETSDAARYAADRIREFERGLADEDAPSRYEQWMSFYERERIEAVSTGLIFLRRSTDGRAPWIRFDDVPHAMLGDCGHQVSARFDAADLMTYLKEDAELFSLRLTLSPDVRIRLQIAPGNEEAGDTFTQLRFVRGFQYAQSAEHWLVELCRRCDGARPLGEHVAELAAEMEADPKELARAVVSAIRPLVARAFLIPTGD